MHLCDELIAISLVTLWALLVPPNAIGCRIGIFQKISPLDVFKCPVWPDYLPITSSCFDFISSSYLIWWKLLHGFGIFIHFMLLNMEEPSWPHQHPMIPTVKKCLFSMHGDSSHSQVEHIFVKDMFIWNNFPLKTSVMLISSSNWPCLVLNGEEGSLHLSNTIVYAFYQIVTAVFIWGVNLRLILLSGGYQL